MAVVFPKNSFVKINDQGDWRWEVHNIAYRKGQDRVYKILSSPIEKWDHTLYLCSWVNKNGKRVGSHTYSIRSDEIDLNFQTGLKLEHWL